MTGHDTPNAGAIVAEFCDRWEQGNPDAVMAFFTEDAVYHNIPWDPLVGKQAIDDFVRPFLSTSSISFETTLQVVDGNIVMNERLDTLDLGKGPSTIPVMGVFEVVDGKISKWRDYFDPKMFGG